MKGRTARASGGSAYENGPESSSEKGVKVKDSDSGAKWYSGDSSNVKGEAEQKTGFKKGGKVPGLGNAIEGGNWENRPADTAKPGVKNTTTGEVKEANAGGYKHGGKASKKAYATGGNVVSDGKAEKMPRHFVSRPVANSLQSGTFKKGGKVKAKPKKMASGGETSMGKVKTAAPSRDGVAVKGKTKGKMVKMCGGGMAKKGK